MTGKPLKRALVSLKPLDADAPSRLPASTRAFAMIKAGRYTFVASNPAAFRSWIRRPDAA